MEEGEVITRVQFQMKFDGLEGLEASLRSVYEQTCSLGMLLFQQKATIYCIYNTKKIELTSKTIYILQYLLLQ